MNAKTLANHFWAFMGREFVPCDLRAFIRLEIGGREPWSSGYGRQLMLERLWVRNPRPAIHWMGMPFFTLICCKNCFVCLKRPKINEKEAGLAHLKKPLATGLTGSN